MNTSDLANNLLIKTDLILDPLALTFLKQALLLVQEYLRSFATDPEVFRRKMVLAFGKVSDAESLRKAWLLGNFNILPTIEILSASEINGANGAYAVKTDTIYLSIEFLAKNQDNLEVLSRLLLEELGHRVDVQLNEVDAPGDEGKLFSLLVREEQLSQQHIKQLKAKDDTANIVLDGQELLIEQNHLATDENDLLFGDHELDYSTTPPIIIAKPVADVIDGKGGNDIIAGGELNDTLSGGLGDDLLRGENGDDTLNGDDGDDTLNGDDGNDELIGGTGDDRLNGNTGDDTLKGDGGNDTLNGDDGNDELIGGDSNDALNGNTGDDRLYADDGNDMLNGGDGDDELIGGDGDDELIGGDGDDELIGGTGDDRLNGNTGDDKLYADDGNDTIDGGDGQDLLAINQSANRSSSERYTVVASGGAGSDILSAPVNRFASRFDKFEFQGGRDSDLYLFNVLRSLPSDKSSYLVSDEQGDEDVLSIISLDSNFSSGQSPNSVINPWELQKDQIGISQNENDPTQLLVDINQDGVLDLNSDLVIQNFFNLTARTTSEGKPIYEKGAGFIELMPLLGIDRWWGVAGSEEKVPITWTVEVDELGKYNFDIIGGWEFAERNLKVKAHSAVLYGEDGKPLETFKAEQGYEVTINKTFDLDSLGSTDIGYLTPGLYSFTVDGFQVPNRPEVTNVGFQLNSENNTESLATYLVADYDESSVQDSNVQALIEKYAPALYFTQGELHSTPLDVENYFINNSAGTLEKKSWKQLLQDQAVEGLTTANEDVIVQRGSSHTVVDLLDFREGTPSQNSDGVIYAAVVQHPTKPNEIAINYYFHYGRSNWADYGGINTHEGDWEGITVFIRDGEPYQAAFAQHVKTSISSGGQLFNWQDVEIDPASGRPKVYVSLGGHASFARAEKSGFPYVDSHNGDGTFRFPQVKYLPRVGSGYTTTGGAAPEWLLFPGKWGRQNEGVPLSILGMGSTGDDGIEGPVFQSLGFGNGTRWLDPWTWSSAFGTFSSSSNSSPEEPVTTSNQNDRLDGGPGNVSLIGNGGNDRLRGSAENDTLLGGSGDDYLAGQAGDDVLNGGSGNDRLIGGTGNDRLVGSGGNDQLSPDRGNDVLFGGLGKDIFRLDRRGFSVIEDFKVKKDSLSVRGILFSRLAFTQEGEDTIVKLRNISIAQLKGVNAAKMFHMNLGELQAGDQR